MAKFVWLQGTKGPTCQIWWTGDMTREQKPVATLQEHAMTDLDEAMTMQQLSEKYPLNRKTEP